MYLLGPKGYPKARGMDYVEPPKGIPNNAVKEQGTKKESMMKPREVKNGTKASGRFLSYNRIEQYNSPLDPNYCQKFGRNKVQNEHKKWHSQSEVCTSDCRFHQQSNEQRCIQKIYSRNCGCNNEGKEDKTAQEIGKMQYVVSIRD